MALSIGIKENDFWNMTLHTLELHVEAFEKEQLRLDQIMHTMGAYVHSAVISALDKVWNGKKSRKEYVKDPFSALNKKEKKMTERELQKQREKFVAGLLAMQSNWELEHKKEK